jgi:hypothetical protein
VTVHTAAQTPTIEGARPQQPSVALRRSRSGKRLALAIRPEELSRAFGVEDAATAARLLSQLVNVLNPEAGDGMDAAAVKEAVALLRGIGPAGDLEALTATMLVATQHAALDCARRALHPDQTPGGREMYLSLALEAVRAFAQLLAAFNQGRGQGVVRQEIVVQHVTVETGAQAIVGSVNRRRG